ncbi:ATP-binding protein [Sedimentibacter sp.]|uniref:ATP-binding protein n=1 Tax=Sedimentibacter sp. TaxID=1960295 RepID=UPI00289A5ADB|nr:ATP-binding protein [Sedimentibacter sp.]
MNDFYLDLTPDPKVLIALTHTPIQPLDALCELIDNSIDSFNSAKLQGNPIENPIISIELPKLNEIENNIGIVRITDNGPGLTKEMAEKALKAGFSGNNPYDSLGLFGMGFNIASGKMGSVTSMVTAREENDYAISVTINLEDINNNKNYNVSGKAVNKINTLTHGTVIEVSKWWPDGNPNKGFIKKLVQYGNKKIREELGRRYATILRKNEIRIAVNGTNCEAFEHCIWDDSRYVERQKHGKIPAVFRFDQVIHSQKRCNHCMTTLEGMQTQCPSCSSYEFRTMEEKITGWVGIQRYDDLAEFGIDLIRNGRAIRISEKSAFFEYVDEFKKTIKDYPVDSNFGRIVGEVHINHVPVDFLKQDFQRSSPEWQRAISFLRGDSSLQPKQEGTENNNSPIYKLFQGYRKVKTPGKTDMYMGYWDPVKEEPRRITRDIEKEFYEKFKNKEPGYYDDVEWWKKVEEADKKPIREMPMCPECGAQNLEDAEVCTVCQHILKGKNCINESCSSLIPMSARSCPICGTSQDIEILKPWLCDVCGTRNPSGIEICNVCGQTKGTENHLTMKYLLKFSNKDDSLSIESCTVKLANNSNSVPIRVNVYVTSVAIKPNLGDTSIPVISFKDSLEELNIFVDKSHRMFNSFQLHPEQIIATEIADRIYIVNRALNNNVGIHTVPNISWQIIEKYWAENMEENSDDTLFSIQLFFETIQEKLAITIDTDAVSCYEEMSDLQIKEMANNIINLGIDISKLSSMKISGEYLKYVSPEFIVDIFNIMPHLFFDNKVWTVEYNNINAPEQIKRLSQERTRYIYKNCLDDLISYMKFKTQDTMIVKRTKLSLHYLQQKVVN